MKKQQDEWMEKELATSAISSEFAKSFVEDRSAVEIFNILVEHLKEEHKYTDKDIADFSRKAKQELRESIPIPISALQNTKLGPLEVIVKFLKENKELSYHEIAQILGRDDRSIWATYRNAKKKQPEPLEIGKTKYSIPAKHFADRSLSILEHITKYLKDYFSLTYHQIAVITKRNDRTIWTVYNRAKKKQAKKSE